MYSNTLASLAPPFKINYHLTNVHYELPKFSGGKTSDARCSLRSAHASPKSLSAS